MILFAGRVDPTKGLTNLLEALHHMEERANLVVCGAGSDPSSSNGYTASPGAARSPGWTDGWT